MPCEGGVISVMVGGGELDINVKLWSDDVLNDDVMTSPHLVNTSHVQHLTSGHTDWTIITSVTHTTCCNNTTCCSNSHLLLSTASFSSHSKVYIYIYINKTFDLMYSIYESTLKL